jgi:proteasome lid subunit RPN8/RPN11
VSPVVRTLVLPRAVRRALVGHARRERPRECCGFLLGRGRRVICALPMRNIEPGVTRYRIDDAAHMELRRVLRGCVPAFSIVGVYHSHPKGRAAPSPTDLTEAMYQEWTYVIVGLGARRPEVRGFRIAGGRAREVTIRAEA